MEKSVKVFLVLIAIMLVGVLASSLYLKNVVDDIDYVVFKTESNENNVSGLNVTETEANVSLEEINYTNESDTNISYKNVLDNESLE